MHTDDRAPEASDDDIVAVRGLFDARSGCRTFSQRILHFGTGSSAPRQRPGLRRGALRARRPRPRQLARREPTTCMPAPRVYVGAGTSWSVDGAGRALGPVGRSIRDPRAGLDHARSAGSRRARGAAAATAGRQFRLLATPEVGCDVGDAVRRLHPARPRARPLPQVRRGRLRARGRGRSAHRRRVGAASPRLVRCTCRRGSSIRSRTRARARCRCSASSARPARRPRPTTPTARRRSSRQRRRAEMPRIERNAEVVWEGNVARGEARSRPAAVRSRPSPTPWPRGSATRRGRRAPRSCSRPPTAAASRCRSPASSSASASPPGASTRPA